MFDYNHDGKMNSSEQANANAYRESVGSRLSLRRGPYGIFVFFLAVYVFMLAIESISNYDADADKREREKDMKAQREEFENAQTVNYFYDDGTESDEDNSYDEEYDITSEDEWYYYFDNEE